MAEQAPLLEKADYYGDNDFRPGWTGKKVCILIALIVLSPLWVPLILLSFTFFCCVKLSNNQIQTLKAVKLFEPWIKAPGKKQEVVESSKDVFDIKLASKDFVDDKGFMHFCGGNGVSLRKSLECTVDQHIRESPYGTKVTSDTDVDRPRYLLNGSTYKYDPKFDEVWCTSARMCHWPALYSWSPCLPEGVSWSSWTQKNNMNNLPDVLGYIRLFEVTNPKFYETDRVFYVGPKAVNSPTITPENEGKVFVRYNYLDAYYFGNLKRSDPDAYIFKGKTTADAEIKLRYEYRIMKPVE